MQGLTANRLANLYSLGGVLLAVALLLEVTAPRGIEAMSFKVGGQSLPLQEMPWFYKTGDRPYEVVFRLAPSSSTQLVRVLPDGCIDKIRLSGEPVELGRDVNPCNDRGGFLLRFKPSRVERTLVVEGHALGDKAGLRVAIDETKPRRPWAFISFSCALLVLVYRFLSDRAWPWQVIVAPLSGLALRLLYWSYTPGLTRSHDVFGHIHYITLLGRSWVPPDPNACWQCYQPPLYYYVGALFSGIAHWWRLTVSLYGEVQAVSVAASAVFLLAGVSTLRLLLPPGRALWIAALLFAWWPSAVVHSARIGNDAFLYLFAGLSLRSLARWQTRGYAVKDALWSAAFACLALTSKSNGLVLVAIVVLPLGIHALRSRFRNSDANRALGGAVLFAFGTSILTLARPIFRYLTGVSKNVLVANASGFGDGLLVHNRLKNFLWFDLKTWLTVPNTTARHDTGGRQWFLNYSGKTALFGQFDLHKALLGTAATTVISVAALALALIALRGVVQFRRERAILPWISALAIFTASLAALRYGYPYACSSDFRYILPALIPFCYLIGKGLERPMSTPILRGLTWAMIAAFLLSSLWLFVVMAR